MAQIQKGQTFADGDLVTGVKLNNIVDNAVLNPESITDQPLVTTASLNDKFCIYQSESAGLKSITLDSILGITMPPLTVGQLLAFGSNSISIQSQNNVTITGANAVTISAGYGSGSEEPLKLESANAVIIGGILGNSSVSVIAPINISSKLSLTSTGAMKLPVGTTAQRPSVPVTGDLRFNTTTNHTEVYNGTGWEAVGGSPFDATGGNQVIAPDNTVVSASFSSTDGEVVVMTSSGHSVVAGQVINVTTSVAGYSGNWTVIYSDTSTFTFVLTTPAIPNSGSCTYKKAGNCKIHVFTSYGTFTAGDTDGNVEVLVVGGGGGGGGPMGGAAGAGGGGGGAVCYSPYYHISAGQVISVTVGSGGGGGADGTASVFGNIIAGGGHAGTGYGGSSGTGSLGVQSFAGGNYQGGGGGTRGNGQNNGEAEISSAGDGGAGTGSNIRGFTETFGGGGGGGGNGGSRWRASGCGVDGGGKPYAYDPRPNSGGGGGGGMMGGGGQSGANGIVIIRYPYWI